VAQVGIGLGCVAVFAEPIIVVLGPWCGGTSAVAGVLHHHGVFMGTQFEWNYRELHVTWEDSSRRLPAGLGVPTHPRGAPVWPGPTARQREPPPARVPFRRARRRNPATGQRHHGAAPGHLHVAVSRGAGDLRVVHRQADRGVHAEALPAGPPRLPDDDRQRIARNRDLSVPSMLEAASSYPDALVRKRNTLHHRRLTRW
jgi:hypothetical protein